MAFDKGIQMSIAGSPCLIEGTTLSSRQSWEIPWALPSGFTSSSGYSSLYIPLLVIIQIQYIILNNGILKLNSSVLPLSEGFISQNTFLGVYGIIVNKASLLCRLQAQTLTDATPPIGKIHPFNKTVEPMKARGPSGVQSGFALRNSFSTVRLRFDWQNCFPLRAAGSKEILYSVRVSQ